MSHDEFFKMKGMSWRNHGRRAMMIRYDLIIQRMRMPDGYLLTMIFRELAMSSLLLRTISTADVPVYIE